MYKYFSFFVILFLLNSCWINKYPRKKELLDYITNELKIDIKDDSYLIFVLQTHVCSACLEGQIDLISELSKKYNCKIIITLKKADVIKWINDKGLQDILYVGNFETISNYGLISYCSEFVHIMNGEIVNWDILKENKINQLKHIYLK